MLIKMIHARPEYNLSGFIFNITWVYLLNIQHTEVNEAWFQFLFVAERSDEEKRILSVSLCFYVYPSTLVTVLEITDIVHSLVNNCSYLGGLVVRGVEALDGDFSEDVWLQRLLSQVTVVNDGWMQQKKNLFVLQSLNRFGNAWGNYFSILPIQKLS